MHGSRAPEWLREVFDFLLEKEKKMKERSSKEKPLQVLTNVDEKTRHNTTRCRYDNTFLFRFWHFCTFEASHYLHGWGVFQTGAETIGRAFPMTEVNGVRFDFNLQHILICAIMICTQYMHYGRTTRDIMEEGITLTKEEKKKRAKAEEKKRRALAAE